MEQTVPVKQNIIRKLWNGFLRSGERMREEEEEIRDLRLEQLRAEEEAIEKYGSVKFAEHGEEPERDLKFFELMDAIGERFVRLRNAVWAWMKRMAKKSAAFASLVRLISKRSRARAMRMAERAVSGFDDAGESIFEHLPESWQAAYLTLEDDVVSMVEEKEEAVRSRLALWRVKRRTNALRIHDAGTVAWERIRFFAGTNSLLCFAIAFTLLFTAAGLGYNAYAHRYYEYSYNGKLLGTVKEKRDVTDTIDLIVEKMDAVYGGEFRIDAREDLSFRAVYGSNLKTDSADEILTNLSYLQDVSAYGYAIVADGEILAILENETAAKVVLRKVVSSYTDENVSYDEKTIRETVSVERVATTKSHILSEEAALSAIRSATKETRTYTVANGDTFSAIAGLAGLTVAELHSYNPDVNTDKLKVGQVLLLESEKPALTVRTVSEETFDEEIPFETVYVDDEGLYQGESYLKVAGKAGEHLVTATVVRENGDVTETEILDETILSEPVSQIVVRGTKPVPAREGTGTFIWPTAGYISSRFGMRWGRLHMGVDIAFGLGIPIYAADGGTVIASNWNDSYGYFILIDHGNGISTRYAHCSKLLVDIGEKVYQGQKIALMGSTGNSTGPHLHFEVRINDVPKDPLNYLP